MKGIRIGSDGAFIMDFATFQDLDYAQLCDRLGLKPSKPWHNAAGKYVGPKRRRKRPPRKDPSGA